MALGLSTFNCKCRRLKIVETIEAIEQIACLCLKIHSLCLARIRGVNSSSVYVWRRWFQNNLQITQRFGYIQEFNEFADMELVILRYFRAIVRKVSDLLFRDYLDSGHILQVQGQFGLFLVWICLQAKTQIQPLQVKYSLKGFPLVYKRTHSP